MNVVLSPETQRLLEDGMRDGHYNSPDELIRVALGMLQGDAIEDLDDDTQAAIAAPKNKPIAAKVYRLMTPSRNFDASIWEFNEHASRSKNFLTVSRSTRVAATASGLFIR